MPTKNGNSTISEKKNITTEETTTKNATTTTSIHKPLNLCENYATVVDDSRLFSNSLEERKCDFYFKKAVRFMSSDGKNLRLKEKCSDDEVEQLRYYCGSDGLTYMEQLHPDESDIPTSATICVNTFFDISIDGETSQRRDDVFPRPDCKCNSRHYILVQNCSGFYVYQIVPLSPVDVECPARYCTEEFSKYLFCCYYFFLFLFLRFV